MCKTINIAINEDGCINFIYDDDLCDIISHLKDGYGSIRRASYVEPRKDGWYITFMNGEEIGPFVSRTAAIDREKQLLLEGEIK